MLINALYTDEMGCSERLCPVSMRRAFTVRLIAADCRSANIEANLLPNSSVVASDWPAMTAIYCLS